LDLDNNKKQHDPFKVRLTVIALFWGIVLLAYIGVLYQAQVVQGSEYLAQSITSTAKTETATASRGIITDRNGKVLVSNQASYVLRFDASLFETNQQINDAILRLLGLLQQNAVTWIDDLPVTATAPFEYTLENATEDQSADFQAYLDNQNLKANQLNAKQLIAKMRKDFEIADSYTDEEARQIAGIRYGLKLLAIGGSDTLVLAENISVELMSQIADGNYLGASTGTSSVRKYETTYAAHILGRIGRIDAEEYKTLADQGYPMNALVGKDGVESAFEQYLHGVDGTSLLTTDTTGKVTGEVYAVEPQPGDTVALTIDINLQKIVEDSLAKRIGAMESDGTKRGGAAVVMSIGTGEVLALASYPTYDLSTFYDDYDKLLAADPSPMFNRATDGTYAPGSTFKPCTATAALESGTITTTTQIVDKGIYTYYSNPQPTCWIYSATGGTHGAVNVTRAITVSCNYFFYEVGRLTGIATIDQYAKQFGLGEHTGIEIGDSTGALASPEYAEEAGLEWTDGQTLTAAIGQSYNLFTPIQLANYIATLAGGGAHYPAHLLKNVKTYDNSEMVYSYDETPTNTVSIQPENLQAILLGMHNLTTGSLAGNFADCVVSAGAKTGTAETGGTTANGVFVAFAPYENPQIAVAVVIEKGGSGAALASIAVDAINGYFATEEIGTAIIGENELLK
jgi:penicillin-binding protein 2